MRKFIAVCIAIGAVCDVFSAFGAATVLTPKKASSVAKREESTSVTSVGGSLLPNAIGLVGNVMQLSKQQKELVAECEPTQKEITFVNNLVKEWAIAGAANPMDTGAFGVSECPFSVSYQDRVSEQASTLDSEDLCYEVYSDIEARGAVWVGFPKVTVATYCPNGDTCAKSKQKTISNIYEIFNAIDFSEQDYTKAEASQANALLEKSSKCSGSQLAAKRLESFGGFITNTIGNMGQKTNTASVMEAVTGAVGSSGLGGLVGSFGGIAGQLLDR